jgi:hypothetical protein
MKKPINKIALLMWAVAAIVGIVQAADLWWNFANTWQHDPEIINADPLGTTIGTLVHMAMQVVLPVVLLVGTGALTEILDGIRWNTRRADESKL